LEKEALEIADKVESYGQKGFARAIRNSVESNLLPVDEKKLDFWRKKEQEFSAQVGKAKEPIKEKVSMENFAKGYPNDIKRLRESNNLFDTETFDIVNKTNDYLQKLTDKLNSLGYSYLSQGITNNEADKLKRKIFQMAGSTSRLLKEHEHLFKNDRFANQKKYDGVVKTLEQDFKEANELLGLKQEKLKETKEVKGEFYPEDKSKFSDGKIVYKNGDYGLMETTDPRGNIIYKPMYKGQTPFLQIEVDAKSISDKTKINPWIEKNISPSMIEDLKKATDILKKSANKKHEKNPFVTYKNGLAFSEGVSKEISGILDIVPPKLS